MEKQLERLSERLRILILQNVHYKSDYDSRFLEEVHSVSGEMLRLKKQLQKAGQTVPVAVAEMDDLSVF